MKKKTFQKIGTRITFPISFIICFLYFDGGFAFLFSWVLWFITIIIVVTISNIIYGKEKQGELNNNDLKNPSRFAIEDIIERHGSNKIEAIKEIKELENISLARAKQIYESKVRYTSLAQASAFTEKSRNNRNSPEL